MTTPRPTADTLAAGSTTGARSSFPIPTGSIRLAWDGAPGLAFNVYRAKDGAPVYETLAERLSAFTFQDLNIDFGVHEIVTYKVTACRPDGSGESDGLVQTINHATQLDLERYRHRVRQLN